MNKSNKRYTTILKDMIQNNIDLSNSLKSSLEHLNIISDYFDKILKIYDVSLDKNEKCDKTLNELKQCMKLSFENEIVVDEPIICDYIESDETDPVCIRDIIKNKE